MILSNRNMAIEKQEYSRSDDELRSLFFQTFTSPTDAIITVDKEENKTLQSSKNKKTNNLVSNPFVSSRCEVIIIDDDDEEETLDSKKTRNLNIDSLVPSTNSVITMDKEETLEPKKKKPRLGSWWDEVDAFDELSFVVKGLPKSKDAAAAASIVDSRFSLTNLSETKPKEGYSDNVTGNNKRNQDSLGYGHVSLEDSCVSVENPSLGGYVSDIISPMGLCFSSSSSTCLLNTEANTKEEALPSSHHGNNFIDLSEHKIVRESTNSSKKGYRHVSLEELGVSVEDLKSMPWEAFDPTWEIRSETMDPWLGGYNHDMFSAH